MKLLDKEDPRERAARRRGGLKVAVISLAALGVSILAVRESTSVSGSLGTYLFLGGVLGVLASAIGFTIGIFDAFFPPVSRAVSIIILGIIVAASVVYAVFFDESGVTQ